MNTLTWNGAYRGRRCCRRIVNKISVSVRIKIKIKKPPSFTRWIIVKINDAPRNFIFKFMTRRFPWMDIVVRRPSSAAPSSGSYIALSFFSGILYCCRGCVCNNDVSNNNGAIISGDGCTILIIIIIILHYYCYYYCGARGFVANGTTTARDKVAVFKNSLFRCTVIVRQ